MTVQELIRSLQNDKKRLIEENENLKQVVKGLQDELDSLHKLLDCKEEEKPKKSSKKRKNVEPIEDKENAEGLEG